ncbi:MAG: VOC family protein [Planctomycetaceae bacterium]|nr:VOC family protein [Planctomycetaceae bacterium]
MSVSPVPVGYHTVTPYLIVDGAKEAIAFYQSAFGATEKLRLEMGDKLGHAEIQIGDSVVMLADEQPEMGIVAPTKTNALCAHIMLYVADVDTVFEKAIAAGATVERPLQDQFYGDRTATIADPFGHKWTIGTHVEDVSQEEVERRFAEMMKKNSQ